MLTAIKVGFFLASRYIKRANKWATVLVVLVMMLTFLNLVMVTGILVGLIAGAEDAYRTRYSGDIFIDTYPEDRYIERSTFVRNVLDSLPGVEDYTYRYIESGTIEANYQLAVSQPNVLRDTAGTSFAGVDPDRERRVTGIDDFIVEGAWLRPEDEGFVVLGANLIARYLPGDFGFATIEDARPGDKIRIELDGIQKEMTVKGIIKSKADAVDLRVFFVDREFRNMIDRTDLNVDEISIKATPEADLVALRDAIKRSGVDDVARVRVWQESLSQFLEDIKNTFALLGNVIGATSLVVASITVFIVIFITAITRRKFIGILKGIGITDTTIEASYIMLSLFYAIIGVSIGLAILYGFMVPYFQENPLNFPFSDGILAVTTGGTATRVELLMITTIIAGYIPAKIVVSKNALDSIQGR